jgi:hypothetical protein
MLNLTLVEQLAWHEFRGDSEESTEETTNRGQTAFELGVVRRVRVLNAGIDDGADAETDASPYNGSNDYRPGRVAGSDELDFGPGQRD